MSHPALTHQSTQQTDLDTALEHFFAVVSPMADLMERRNGWCLTAAALTQAVLDRFGYPGVRVLGVRFTAYNAPAYRLHRAGVPVEQWPDDAWSVGVAGTGRTSGTSWDGHAVAYVPGRVADGQDRLIDASAGQFARPQHGLMLGPMVMASDRDFLQGNAAEYTLQGVHLYLQHVPALTQWALKEVRSGERALREMADVVTARMIGRMNSGI